MHDILIILIEAMCFYSDPLDHVTMKVSLGVSIPVLSL